MDDEVGAYAGSQGQRQTSEERGHGCHHDGAETQQTGFVDGIEGRLPFLALRFEGESIIMMAFFLTMPISRMIPITR